MEQLYLLIFERIIEKFPELRWIDLEKGQMQQDKPPMVFPAALIDIKLPKTENMNDVNQRCMAYVTITLCFSFTGDRESSAFSAGDRAASFEYLKLSRKLYEKLQGWEAKDYSPLERVNSGEPFKRPGYKINATTFKTEYFETSFEPLYLGDNFENLITDSEGNLIQVNEI